jgi:membrane fusion protein (multidrug efflux system)
VGSNLSIGQDLLTIIPLTDLWVTANFKETQIQHMHPGQDVTIEVDALGGRKFHGKLTQIGGATGSRLSLFPPENATGNYVKVVQRIPVRISVATADPGPQLRAGMSTEVEIDTHYSRPLPGFIRVGLSWFDRLAGQQTAQAHTMDTAK